MILQCAGLRSISSGHAIHLSCCHNHHLPTRLRPNILYPDVPLHDAPDHRSRPRNIRRLLLHTDRLLTHALWRLPGLDKDCRDQSPYDRIFEALCNGGAFPHVAASSIAMSVLCSRQRRAWTAADSHLRGSVHTRTHSCGDWQCIDGICPQLGILSNQQGRWRSDGIGLRQCQAVPYNTVSHHHMT